MTLILDGSIQSRIALFACTYIDSGIKHKNEEAPACRDILPPSFITSTGGDEKNTPLVTCGLCNVVRQTVKYAMKMQSCAETKSKLLSLLGYKQSCLKGASAISRWTDFCEKSFPIAIMGMISNFNASKFMLLKEVIQLEKELSVPKKTVNSKKLKKQEYKPFDQPIVDIQSIKDLLNKINLTWSCSPSSHKFAKSSCIPKSEVTEAENNLFWPFLCGFNITIADLVILPALCELFCSMPCTCFIIQFFFNFPNIFSWFKGCCDQPNVPETFYETFNKVALSKTCGAVEFPIFSYDTDINSIVHISYEGITPNTIHSKIVKGLPGILNKLSANYIQPIFTDNTVESISWSEAPKEVDPLNGQLGSARALRKRQQIENMISLVLPIVGSGKKIVEFCAGGGHLGIVLAFLRPDCHVILVENKEESISRAQSRIQSLNLTNVTLYLSNVEHFRGDFDVGLALHACGSATDMVLTKCRVANASFVISPCCYGGIKASKSLQYPASKRYSISGISESEFTILSHSADQTNSDYGSEYNRQGKQCMLYVDYDRVLSMEEEERGYTTKVCSMFPESCSPKNNIIVGKSNRK